MAFNEIIDTNMKRGVSRISDFLFPFHHVGHAVTLNWNPESCECDLHLQPLCFVSHRGVSQSEQNADFAFFHLAM